MPHTKKQAQSDAEDCMRGLDATQWEIDVFNNLGWFGCARHRELNMTISKYGEMYCLTGKAEIAASGGWGSATHKAESPTALLRKSADRLREQAEYLRKLAEGVEGSIR